MPGGEARGGESYGFDGVSCGRAQAEGTPVPANTFVSLVHVNTQLALHTGPTMIPNKYGGEYEVSAFQDAAVTKSTFGERKAKMLGVGNHWAFTTAEAPAASS